jgi:hypothetical protein
VLVIFLYFLLVGLLVDFFFIVVISPAALEDVEFAFLAGRARISSSVSSESEAEADAMAVVDPSSLKGVEVTFLADCVRLSSSVSSESEAEEYTLGAGVMTYILVISCIQQISCRCVTYVGFSLFSRRYRLVVCFSFLLFFVQSLFT